MKQRLSFLALAYLILSISITAQAATESGMGVVTLCDGECTIIREGHRLIAQRGSLVNRGDRLESYDAQVVVTFNDGPVLTIAKYTSILVDHTPTNWNVTLAQGEIRAVHDGRSLFNIYSNFGAIHPGRSIVRARVGDTFCVGIKGGHAGISFANTLQGYLESDGIYDIAPDHTIMTKEQESWSINPSQIRLATAQQVVPNLQLPAVQAPLDNGSQPLLNPTNDPAIPDPVQPDQLLADEEDELPTQQQVATRGSQNSDDDELPTASATNTFAGSSSLSLGALSSSTFGFSSGGLFADANQQTFQGSLQNPTQGIPAGNPFPGAIHLVTASASYAFDSVKLSAGELNTLFLGAPSFFSIGRGSGPDSQVVTDYFTGSNATNATVIPVPQTDTYLVGLDQYAIADAGDPNSGGLQSNIGLTGLIGANPQGPVIVGATPVADNRRGRISFALGDFLVSQDGANGIRFHIRASDQDRFIVKDAFGNDANDQVTTNEDVVFTDSNDARFLPQSPTVKVPDVSAPSGPYNPGGTTYSELGKDRQAAFTTLIADRLHDFSSRTNQTRFVVDGRIIDIRGYQKP